MRIACIGMGGNLASWAGEPPATLAAAALRLESLGRVVRRSPLYSTEPVGFAEQPRFVNAAVALETEMEPQELLRGLLAIEKEFGRDRVGGFANGPRTLDLDILLLGNLEISAPNLEIPHPRLAERAFVLIPLAEIAPEAIVPRTGKTVGQLLQELREGSVSARDRVVQIQSDLWEKSQVSKSRPGAHGALALSAGEAFRVQQGEAEIKAGRSKSWRSVKDELDR